MAIQDHFSKYHRNIKLSQKDEAYKEVKEKGESILSDIKKAFKEAGYPVRDTIRQGSFSTHTAIISVDGDYDLDRGIIIDEDDAPDDPVAVKKVVLETLEKRGFKNVKIKNPCVTADYASLKMHIDFPVYRREKAFLGLGDDTLSIAWGKPGSNDDHKVWSTSEPVKLTEWVLDDQHHQGWLALTGAQREQYRRIVRYLKRWRDVAFVEAVRKHIYSIGLTIMAKEQFVPSVNDEGYPNDLDSLTGTVRKILNSDYFTEVDTDKCDVEVELPVEPHSDVFGRHGTTIGTKLYNRFSHLHEKLVSAQKEDDEVKQCEILRSVLGEYFEVPEKKSSAAKLMTASAGIVGTSQGA